MSDLSALTLFKILISVMKRQQKDALVLRLHSEALHRRIDCLEGILGLMLDDEESERHQEITPLLADLKNMNFTKELEIAATSEIAPSDQFDALLEDLERRLEAE